MLPPAAKAFVQLVFDTPVLSATAFLNNLYWLEGNDWKTIPIAKQSKATDQFDVGSDPESRMAIGFATIGSWMGGGSTRDDTLSICHSFLMWHREEISATEEEIEDKLNYRKLWGIYG